MGVSAKMVLNNAAYFGIGILLGLAYSVITLLIIERSNKRYKDLMLEERRIMRNQMLNFMDEVGSRKKTAKKKRK